VAVILTYRSDEMHRRHPLRPFLAEIARRPSVHRLMLEPLSAGDMAELIASRGPLASGAVDRIVDRAEGNAFFAEELLEAERSAAESGRTEGPANIPDALLDVLIARLEQLDHNAARVVGVAAVAGRRVENDVLAEVAGPPETELNEALRDAVARHILVPDGDAGTYQFRHALLQEAAYAEMLPGERVRLHRDYARALSARLSSAPAVAAELAYHAELCHDLPLALEATMRASEHARQVLAPSDTQRHLEKALAWWGSVPDAAEVAGAQEWEVLLRAGEAASAAGDAIRAVTLLALAVDVIDALTGPEPDAADLAACVTVRSRYAAALNAAGDSRDQAVISEAAALAEDLPPGRARAEARCTQALVLASHGLKDAAAAAHLALADANALGAADLQAQALVTLARIAEHGGDTDTAATHLTHALKLSQDSQDVATELRTMYYLAMSRYDAGDLRQTLEWTRRCIDRAAAMGMTYSTYPHAARGIDVIARYVCGDWDVALDPLWDAERIPTNARALLEAFSLHIAVGRGLPDIPERLRIIREDPHPDPDIDVQLVMLSGGCEIDHLTWQHDPEAALRAYHATIDYPNKMWGQYYLGRIWLDSLALAALADIAAQARLRDEDDAATEAVEQGRTIIEDARQTAELGEPRSGQLGAEGVAWLARGEAEWSRLQGDQDASVWRTALAAFDYGYTYEVARCRWRLAEALLDRAVVSADGSIQAREEATELLRLAMADAQKLRAAPMIDAITALSRRARLNGPGRGTVAGPLTTREEEVLALLASGRTNRQLGKELFISEKTVSVHVSNIMGKLGAHSRGEAVALARQRGLI
jgi:DNA-binding CsgD family transcriptional regulator